MTPIFGAFLVLYAGLWVWVLMRARARGARHPVVAWLGFQAMTLAALLVLFPMVWMLAGSLKSAEEAARVPPTLLPDALAAGQWRVFFDQVKDNYTRAWTSPPRAMTFARYFWVSSVTAGVTTLGVLATSILAAYAFARLRFRGRDALFGALLATIMIPPHVLIIPNYLILERLGWLDSYLALVAPFLASVFVIFMLRQFFRTVPAALWDAARLDGASHGRFLWSVVLPMARPVLTTAAVVTFLAQWNSLMWPLIATTRPEMRTLMVGLQSFGQEGAAEPNLLMAAATFSMLPILVAFFFAQRFFIQSVARTGLKG